MNSRELLKECVRIAKENPERKADCVYVKEGEPCCLVGRALVSLGTSIHDLSAIDMGLIPGLSAWPENPDNFKAVGLDYCAEGEPFFEAVCALQEYQDQEHSWGDALERVAEGTELNLEEL